MTFAELKKYVYKKLVEHDAPIEVELPTGRTSQDVKLEPYSSTWLFMKAWTETELIKARATNDYLKNDEIRTAALRGRIKLLKEILGLPERE